MELLDLYDDQGNLLGKTIERGTKFENGNIMLSIIFIKNSNGKYLIQKVSKEKGIHYSSTGGHVIHGENGQNTIIREMKEELGLNVSANEMLLVGLIKNPDKPCLINLYILNKDIDIKELELQQEEVASVKWLSEKDILNLIKNKKFLASHGFLFKEYIIK